MSVQSIHAFSEKVALVTDGLNPVGRAIALQLALNGSYVIAGYRPVDSEHSDALIEMKSLGTLADAVSSDITTAVGIDALVSAVEGRFGRLDLLVNCLKISPESSFQNCDEDEFRSVAGNFNSVYLVTKRCLPLMMPRPKPRILNVISRGQTANRPLFDATQSAIEGFTKAMAAELPSKFRVNSVAAGSAGSIRDGYDPELFPLARSVSADDVARSALFLLSPEGVGVNGQTLEVNS